MFNIVMLGHQGAGKGTQSDRLADKLGVPMISVGKLFRAEVDRSTGLGKQIQKYISQGDLVPTSLVDQVMRERLSEEDTAKGVILDGFPRMLEQANVLDDILANLERRVTHVVHIKITDDEAVRRLSGRRVCSNARHEQTYHVEFNPPKKNPNVCDGCGYPLIQRKDDTPDAIKHRLDLYHKETKPVLEFYRERGILHDIDGMRPIETVELDIDGLFGA